MRSNQRRYAPTLTRHVQARGAPPVGGCSVVEYEVTVSKRPSGEAAKIGLVERIEF